MIRRETIDGREATVAFLSSGFEPRSPDDAEMVKIIYDDGDVTFAAIVRDDSDAKRSFEWNEEDHPRDDDGKFASGGGGGGTSTEPSTPADKFTSMGSTTKAAPSADDDDERDEFSPPPGGWQAVAEEAREKYLAEHPRVQERTVELKQDLDDAMDAARDYEDVKDWYEEHRPLARSLFAEDEPMFEKFVAATSIQKSGSENIRLAVEAMLNWLGGGKFDTSKDFNAAGVLPAIRDELVLIQNDKSLTGPKVTEFWKALTGDKDAAPMDRHMQELLFEHPSKSGGPSSQTRADVAKAVLNAISEKMGWEARQLQAVLWCVEKARNEKGLEAKIWTLQDFLKEREAGIRAALDVVHGKRSFADALSIIGEMAEGYANAQALLTLIALLREDDEATRGFEWRANEDVDFIQGADGKFQGSHPKGGSDESSAANSSATADTDIAKGADASDADFHPDVVGVGGDEWNKETAVRLEREYRKAAPDLDKIVQATVNKDVETGAEEKDPDDAPYVPDSWESLSGDQQADALNAYQKETYSEYLDSEINNWWEGDDPPAMAMADAVLEFNGGDSEYVDEAVQRYLDFQEPALPYTAENIVDAVSIKYDQNYSGNPLKDVTIEFDDDKLLSSSDLHNKDQITMPGIEPPEKMTDEVKQEITEVIEAALEKRADKLKDKLEPPDYLGESVAEFQEEMWDQMTDAEKFKWVEHNTSIISDAQEEYDNWSTDEEGNVVQFTLPEKYDPLQQDGGKDYARTQVVARALSDKRALELIEKRLGDNKPFSLSMRSVQTADRTLWNGWKGSSTSSEGWLLQVAASEELGARFREIKGTEASYNVLDRDAAIKHANSAYAKIGGYEGVKAYIRAKWETTQYMLEKAGINSVSVYRAVDLNRTDALREKLAKARLAAEIIHTDGGNYVKLSALDLERNGAASTSLERSVSNKWDGNAGRVVLRIEAPRTAVLSVPAYGINVQNERELVVAGSAWHAWEAWDNKAPSFDELPVRQKEAA